MDKRYSHLKAFAHVDVVDVEKCELPSRSKAQEEKEKMHSFPLLSKEAEHYKSLALGWPAARCFETRDQQKRGIPGD